MEDGDESNWSVDDGSQEETNYEGLMLGSGEGVTPGEIPTGSREAEVIASTPMRTPRDRVEVVDLANNSNELRPVELEKVVSTMAQIQQDTGAENAKCIQEALSCIAQLSRTILEKTKSEKRGREDGVDDKIRADPPVTINFKDLQVSDGFDDAHSKICWPIRRQWRSINKDPADYWKDEGEDKGWPKKIVPNLAGQVYLDHLIPHMISDKVLSWLHDVSKTLEVRYFLHSNSKTRSKKNKRMEIEARETESGDGGMHVETYVSWNEAGTVKEMVQAVLNYAAAVFMVRPWDFSGLVLIRCLHDVNFFALCSRDSKERRDLVSEFVEDCFLANARAMSKGKHPLTHKEALELAGKNVSKRNGMAQHLVAQCDVYGMVEKLRAKEEEVKKLKSEVSRLKSQLNEEKQKKKGGGYNDYTSRVNGRPNEEGQARGGGGGKLPHAFVEARKKTCRFFNLGDCRQGAACTGRGDHACSQQVGQGMCGSTDHARPDHK